MAFIPAANTILVFMEYILPNLNLAGNTYWIRDDLGQPDAGRLEDLRLIMQTWENGSARNGRSNQVALTRINLRDMTEESGVTLDYDVSPNIAGASTSPVMPASVTVAISYRTGFAGRSFRGRHYWIGLAESHVAGDYLIAGQMDIILGYFATLRNALFTGNFTLCVASRYHAGAARAAAVVTPVTSIIAVDNRVDTQRRRLIGEGT